MRPDLIEQIGQAIAYLCAGWLVIGALIWLSGWAVKRLRRWQEEG
jgi:hypothetical protein